MRPARKTYSAEAERLRLIKLLHVAKRDLNMAEDSYRGIILEASKGAKESSKDLTLTELERALDHMKRCGFKVVRQAAKGPAREKPSRALAGDPESTKIRALWLMLNDLGAVKNPSEAALAAYVKRITGVEALQWIDGLQAERLIETLKKWALRYLPDAVKRLVEEVKASRRLGYMEAMRLNELLNKAYARGTFDPMKDAWLALNEALKGTEGAQ